jgi:hypothetical protein
VLTCTLHAEWQQATTQGVSPMKQSERDGTHAGRDGPTCATNATEHEGLVEHRQPESQADSVRYGRRGAARDAVSPQYPTIKQTLVSFAMVLTCRHSASNARTQRAPEQYRSPYHGPIR